MENVYISYILNNNDDFTYETEQNINTLILHDCSLFITNKDILKLYTDFIELESVVETELLHMYSLRFKSYSTLELKKSVEHFVGIESAALINRLSTRLLKLAESINNHNVKYIQAVDTQKLFLSEKLRSLNYNKINLKEFQQLKINNITDYESTNMRFSTYKLVIKLLTRIHDIIAEPVIKEGDLGNILIYFLKQINTFKQYAPFVNSIIYANENPIGLFMSNDDTNKYLDIYTTRDKTLYELKYKINDIQRFSKAAISLCDEYRQVITTVFSNTTYNKSMFRNAIEKIKFANYSHDRVDVSISAFTRVRRLKILSSICTQLFLSTFIKDLIQINKINHKLLNL